MVAVDTPGSVLFGLPDSKRKLRGLGNSLHPTNLDTALVDAVYWITYDDAASATRTLESLAGIYCGPTSGAAFLAAANEQLTYPMEGDTLFVCPDRGDRYPEVFSNTYHAQSPLPVIPQVDDSKSVQGTSRMEWGRDTVNDAQ